MVGRPHCRYIATRLPKTVAKRRTMSHCGCWQQPNWQTLLLLLALLIQGAPAHAAIDTVHFANPALATRYHQLTDELRCPKCQNTNIANSDAPLAADLRHKVHQLLLAGKTNKQIKHYMVQRYGTFILYNPPVEPLTWPLWFGPFAGVAITALLVGVWVRRRSRTRSSPLSDSERDRLQALLHGNGENTQ